MRRGTGCRICMAKLLDRGRGFDIVIVDF